jgi:HSP20 family protein
MLKMKYRREDWSRAESVLQRLLRENWGVMWKASLWEPPTDVYENENGLIVQVEIAGMQPEDFSIVLQEKLLVIEGTRRDTEPKQVYHRMEIHRGRFRAHVHLPWAVDADEIEATYETGILRIFLPRPPVRRVNVS